MSGRFYKICLKEAQATTWASERRLASDWNSFLTIVFKHWWAAFKYLSNCCPSICRAKWLQIFLNSTLSFRWMGEGPLWLKGAQQCLLQADQLRGRVHHAGQRAAHCHSGQGAGLATPGKGPQLRAPLCSSHHLHLWGARPQPGLLILGPLAPTALLAPQPWLGPQRAWATRWSGGHVVWVARILWGAGTVPPPSLLLQQLQGLQSHHLVADGRH